MYACFILTTQHKCLCCKCTARCCSFTDANHECFLNVSMHGRSATWSATASECGLQSRSCRQMGGMPGCRHLWQRPLWQPRWDSIQAGDRSLHARFVSFISISFCLYDLFWPWFRSKSRFSLYSLGIANADVASIFEEHRICKNSGMLQCEQYRDSMGVYVQDENKFIFNNVLVGRSAKAKFRVTNPGKVPCELSLVIRSVKVCLYNTVFQLVTLILKLLSF